MVKKKNDFMFIFRLHPTLCFCILGRGKFDVAVANGTEKYCVG